MLIYKVIISQYLVHACLGKSTMIKTYKLPLNMQDINRHPSSNNLNNYIINKTERNKTIYKKFMYINYILIIYN